MHWSMTGYRREDTTAGCIFTAGSITAIIIVALFGIRFAWILCGIYGCLALYDLVYGIWANAQQRKADAIPVTAHDPFAAIATGFKDCASVARQTDTQLAVAFSAFGGKARRLTLVECEQLQAFYMKYGVLPLEYYPRGLQ